MKKLILFSQLVLILFSISCSKPTIGFFVKATEDANGEVLIEDWFKEEIQYARKASKDMGFNLIVKKLVDAEAVFAAINEFADNGGEGIVLCSPDISVGEEIKSLVEERGVKLITVDDRLQDSSGKDLEGVPHVGIWGYLIGDTVSSVVADEIVNSKVNIDDLAIFVLEFSKDDKIMARTEGAVEGLLEGLTISTKQFFKADMDEFSPESAKKSISQLYTSRKKDFSRYVVLGGNDDVVLAAVSQLKSMGLDGSKITGVGINGSESALKELEIENSGFFATIKLRADIHGYDTCRYMYSWLTKGEAPKMDNFTDGEVVDRNNLFLYK
ncbi:MAG: substrate-binding domain-containing protein [Spirochaetales bacterium]|nr:substrate-binding domain-containing protein [Spirochaetales bacterium]